MEKKTGRSRKAVQPLKPKKLVYWAWRFRLFWHSCSLQLYFWITRIMIFHAPWHRKLWRYHLQTGTTSLRRRENTEAILECRIRIEWYAKYIDYMIEEGYLEPGDENDK